MAYLLGVFFFVCAAMVGVEHILIATACLVAGGWFFVKATPGGLETLLSFLFAFIVLVLGVAFLQDVYHLVFGYST
jgi:hypothetical protein